MSGHSPTYDPPPDDGLVIRYLDDDLLVVDKPAGLLSVPGCGAEGQECLSARRVAARYPRALPVQRLDMGNFGLIVLASNAAMHRALNKLFETRRVEELRRAGRRVPCRQRAPEQDLQHESAGGPQRRDQTPHRRGRHLPQRSGHLSPGRRTVALADGEWALQRRYMTLETLAEVDDNPNISLSPVTACPAIQPCRSR